jgi:FtsP/CotA-like multicopper oxidase with cupredoxin domain
MMLARTNRPLRRILIAAAFAIGASASIGASVASAAPVSIDLCAKAGTLTLAGSATVPVWGFAQMTAGQTCADVSAQVPGPVLDVNAGDVVTITLHNDLAEPASVEIPGEAVVQGAAEAAAGLTQTYTFTASSPGTFIYQSASNAGRQNAMGLYGALIVRPATSGRAYDDASTAYDTERMLVLSAIDPALNATPDIFDMRTFAPKYWLINGRSYPDTSDIHVSAGQRLLLRYVNAGFDNTTMALLGAHERVIAGDAFALANPFDADAETIPAGATIDAILTIPAAGGRFPIYNRQLHLTNGAGTLDSAGYFPGGMMTFVIGS